MSEIRVVGLLRVKDPEIGWPLLKQISAIAAVIDGVEVWEAFSNEGTDLVYLNERFDSEETYLRYESAVDAEVFGHEWAKPSRSSICCCSPQSRMLGSGPTLMRWEL